MGYLKTIAISIAILTAFFAMIKPVAAVSKKQTEMQKRQESALLIELERDDFVKYVLEEPRDYDVLVYYTLSQKCDHCIAIETELEQVAYSYVQSGKHLPQEGTQRAIFFVKAEYRRENADIFIASDFSSVPIICLATPELAKQFTEKGTAKYEEKYEWKISTQDFSDAGKLLEHVNKVSKNEVELKYTLYRILTGNLIIFAAFGILFFFRDFLGNLLRNKLVWMIGTALIYIQCIGGVAFNIIHKVPTFKYGFDKSGGMIVEEYFQRSQRSQYSGEGYMASLLMFTIGALMVVYAYLNRIKSNLRKEAV